MGAPYYWDIAPNRDFTAEPIELQDKQPLESFAGFEYGACCWRVRFRLRRYISRRPETTDSTSAGPQDTAAWLQLELTGLVGVGSATRCSGHLRAAANRIGIANQPVAVLLALVMAWAI